MGTPAPRLTLVLRPQTVENVPTRNSDVDYRFLEAAKAGDLDTVQVSRTWTPRARPQLTRVLSSPSNCAALRT